MEKDPCLFSQGRGCDRPPLSEKAELLGVILKDGICCSSSAKDKSYTEDRMAKSGSLPAPGQGFFVAVVKHCEFSEHQTDTF